MMIVPTNGRIVWFHASKFCGMIQHDETQPLAAIVTHVWNERMVNLTVFDSNGFPQPRTSVRLLQEGDEPPRAGEAYCEWMPYQKGQAAKTEAAEKTLDVSKVFERTA